MEQGKTGMQPKYFVLGITKETRMRKREMESSCWLRSARLWPQHLLKLMDQPLPESPASTEIAVTRIYRETFLHI